MPKQTKPNMVSVNFRVPPDVKDQALERAQREGINLSDAMRELLTTWVQEAGR